MLGGHAITNTGPSTLDENLGVSPGTAITGFPPVPPTPVTKSLDYATTTSDRTGPFEVIFDTVGTELASYRRRLRQGAS